MKKLILSLGTAVALCPVSALGISVTTSSSATALLNAILDPGTFTIVGTPTLSSTSVSAGTFSGGVSSGIGINSGIVLTSGDASLIDNTNTADGAGADNGLGGDANLNALSGGTTQDTTYLEFSFTHATLTSGTFDLFFNYVFGSEEYNEYTNSQYNDVFGFFLNGSNIALIPGTATPVSINNVNGGNPYGTNATNPQYFNNNDLNDGGSYAFEYDGFTDVFTASAFGLDASAVHTIKLAIADTSDGILDSGVFIQGGTFSDDPTSTPDSTQGILVLSALFLWIAHRSRFIASAVRS